MPLVADNISLAAHGLVNGFKALPVAFAHGARTLGLDVWRVRPRHIHGVAHVSYDIGMVLFILLIVWFVSRLRARRRRLRPATRLRRENGP